jgi:hypothetical protein
MKPDLMLDAVLLARARGRRNSENVSQKSCEHPAIIQPFVIERPAWQLGVLDETSLTP